MLDLTEKDTSPINPVLAFGDGTTSCSLAGGISAGLYRQQRTGKGCKVMISLYAQALWAVNSIIVSGQFGDHYPKTRQEPNGALDLAEDDKYNTPTAIRADTKEITEVIADFYVQHTTAEMVKLLTDADIAYETINHAIDTIKDPQAFANNYVVEVEHLNRERLWARIENPAVA